MSTNDFTLVAKVKKCRASWTTFEAGTLRILPSSRLDIGLTQEPDYKFAGTALETCGHLPQNTAFEATAHIERHPKWGDQVVIDEWHPIGDGADWMYKVASELSGVGAATIDKLRTNVGAGLVDLLNTPGSRDKLVAAGVGPKQATTITAWWHNTGPWHRDLIKGLRRAHVPSPVRQAIEEHLHGTRAWGAYVEMTHDLHGGTMLVPANPFAWCAYRPDRDKDHDEPLRVIDRFSLDMANACAEAWGVPAAAPDRIIATMVGVLEEAARQDGHSCLPTPLLLSKVCMKLGLSLRTDLSQCLASAAQQRFVVIDRRYVYLPRLHKAEQQVAEGVLSRLSLPARTPPPAPPHLNDEQQQAFRAAWEHGVMVLTAPPGRGKSETVVAIANALASEGEQALLVAPTGRAAVRLTELAVKNDVPLALEPGTIQRKLLGPRAVTLEGSGTSVIEESSMCDVETFGAALTELPPSWRVVIVGDADQLPSVGPGNVLGNLIESERVPVLRLEHNWRSESAHLADSIDRIRRGEMPEDGEGFQHIILPSSVFSAPTAIDRTIVTILNELSDKYNQPPEDILILTPRSKANNPSDTKLTTAAQALNQRLRPLFNPRSLSAPKWQKFCKGDKVLHRKNEYLSLGRFNGEQGVVIDVDNSGRVVVAYPDGQTTYSADEAGEYLLFNFAGTVHRNQGGEADVVLFLLRKTDSWLVQRRLIYTAVSRAKRCCVVLAEPGALKAGIDNITSTRRKDLLRERLQEG